MQTARTSLSSSLETLPSPLTSKALNASRTIASGEAPYFSSNATIIFLIPVNHETCQRALLLRDEHCC